MSYKRQKIDPDQFVMLHGKEKHELELVPGVLDLWVQWYADRDVVVTLLYTDGKKIPYSNGLRGQFNVQTFNVLSILLECTKSTTVCVCVSYRDMAVKEKLDFTKLVIAPPAPAMLKLQHMVRTEVAKLTGGDDTIEIGDEDNLEDEGEADDFGGGYMEDEEPLTPVPPVKKPAASPSAPSGERSGGEPVGGAGGDPGGSQPPPA